MSEKNDVGKQEAVTEIAYCPHLDIYHYRRADGSEYLFDSSQLEKSVEGYQKQGDVRQAEFMAMLTGFARQFPHQVVSFDDRGNLNLRELLERKLSVEPEEGQTGLVEGSVGQAPPAAGVEGKKDPALLSVKGTGESK